MNHYEDRDGPAAPSAYAAVAAESVYDLVRDDVFTPNRGQMGWCLEEEIELIHRAILPVTGSEGRLLDLGSGLGGILCELTLRSQCSGIGIDKDPICVARARQRAERLEAGSRVKFYVHDLSAGLDVFCPTVKAVMAIDMLCHVRSRSAVLTQLAAACELGSVLIFTDSMVVQGAVSNELIAERSFFGYTEFVVPGFNDHLLQNCGFELIEKRDHSAAVGSIADSWRRARSKHRQALLSVETEQTFAKMNRYLARCIEGTEKRILRREFYVARLAQKPTE